MADLKKAGFEHIEIGSTFTSKRLQLIDLTALDVLEREVKSVQAEVEKLGQAAPLDFVSVFEN